MTNRWSEYDTSTAARQTGRKHHHCMHFVACMGPAKGSKTISFLMHVSYMHGFAQCHASTCIAYLRSWDPASCMHSLASSSRPCSLITFIASCRPVTNQMHACVHGSSCSSVISISRLKVRLAIAAPRSIFSFPHIACITHACLLAWQALDYLTWCMQHASYLRRDKLACSTCKDTITPLTRSTRPRRERESKAYVVMCYRSSEI